MSDAIFCVNTQQFQTSSWLRPARRVHSLLDGASGEAGDGRDWPLPGVPRAPELRDPFGLGTERSLQVRGAGLARASCASPRQRVPCARWEALDVIMVKRRIPILVKPRLRAPYKFRAMDCAYWTCAGSCVHGSMA